MAHYRAGNHVAMEMSAREFAIQWPVSAVGWKLWGTALSLCGRHEEAVHAKRKSLSINPEDGETASNLANDLLKLSRFSEAKYWSERAAHFNPHVPQVWTHLGHALAALQEHHAAVAAYRQALDLEPASQSRHQAYCQAIARTGDPTRSQKAWTQYLASYPADTHAWNALGNALRDAKKMRQAESAYQRSLSLQSDQPAVLNNLASTWADMGQSESAEMTYRRAIELAPSQPEILSNLGNLLKDTGRIGEALECFRRCIEAAPDFMGAHHNLLLTLNYEESTSPTERLQLARSFGAVASLRAGSTQPFAAQQSKRDQLRVGFVSGDLRSHPVGFFMESWLPYARAQGLECWAYPTVALEDALTARIKPFFEAWHPVSGYSDSQAAQMIASHDIDLLIDLSGHTENTRLPIFAWKPAPLQASWLGYFATTGLPQMDAVISDPISTPIGAEGEFTERVVRLPVTRLCFAAPVCGPEVKPLPALRNGFLTFGCFQNLGKVSDDSLNRWGQVLRALPGSRLRLQGNHLAASGTRQNLLTRLQNFGIDPTKVKLHERTSREKYLEAYSDVDIVLDTSPFPGGTTTCEALWMGVPTLTLRGNSMLSNQGAAIVNAAGLPDWIADSDEDFVRIAIDHAVQLTNLAKLRIGLRERLARSPLFDGASFARDLAHCLQRIVLEDRVTHGK